LLAPGRPLAFGADEHSVRLQNRQHGADWFGGLLNAQRNSWRIGLAEKLGLAPAKA